MILYLDTGAVVKLYLEEGSAEVRAAVDAAEAVCTSVVAYAEVHAALARAVREGRITEEERARAVAEFRSDWPEYRGARNTTGGGAGSGTGAVV